VVEARTGDQADAVLAVELGEQPPDARTEDVRHRDVLRLDDRDRAPVGASGGGELRPDESGTHHDYRGPGGQLPAEGQTVVRRADGVHAWHVLGARKRSRLDTGGDDQGGVGQPLPVGGLHDTGDRVKTSGPDAEAQVDVQAGQLLQGQQGHRLLRRSGGQHLLGQRGLVVRVVQLFADHRDASVESHLSQGLDGADPRHRCADHQYGHRVTLQSVRAGRGRRPGRWSRGGGASGVHHRLPGHSRT
jgi:hypothetical protein